MHNQCIFNFLVETVMIFFREKQQNLLSCEKIFSYKIFFLQLFFFFFACNIPKGLWHTSFGWCAVPSIVLLTGVPQYFNYLTAVSFKKVNTGLLTERRTWQLQFYSQFSLTLSGSLGPIHTLPYLLAVSHGSHLFFYWTLDAHWCFMHNDAQV